MHRLVHQRHLLRTRFASAPTVLGRSLRVNGVPLTIVGVAPERFQGTVLSLTFAATICPVMGFASALTVTSCTPSMDCSTLSTSAG